MLEDAAAALHGATAGIPALERVRAWVWAELEQSKKPANTKPGQWEAVITPRCSTIPIGRKGSDEAPIVIYGKDLPEPEDFARNIVALLNRDEWLRSHPRVYLDGSECVQGLTGPMVEIKPPQHE
jgi:hypothetical protein